MGIFTGIAGFAGGPAVGFLRAYWKQIIIVLAIIGVYLYWLNLTHTVTKQQDEIVQLQVIKAKLTQDVLDQQKQFKSVIDAQNAQITEFQKESDAQKLRIFQAEKQQESIKAYYADKINNIMHEAKPQTCQQSIDYLINASKDLQWGTAK